jgi:hypothetical protein
MQLTIKKDFMFDERFDLKTQCNRTLERIMIDPQPPVPVVKQIEIIGRITCNINMYLIKNIRTV